MKRSTALFVTTLALAIGLGTGFIAGWRHRQFDLALQENKIATVNLKYQSANLSPQFREYLKARIYCNVYNYYPSKPGYLLQKDWDFGPVDHKVLGAIGFWKDPHEKVFDWEAAIRKK